MGAAHLSLTRTSAEWSVPEQRSDQAQDFGDVDLYFLRRYQSGRAFFMGLVEFRTMFLWFSCAALWLLWDIRNDGKDAGNLWLPYCFCTLIAFLATIAFAKTRQERTTTRHEQIQRIPSYHVIYWG